LGPFVLDASIAASWAFDDEESATADLCLEWLRRGSAQVPVVFWFEIRSALLAGERRNRLQASEAEASLAELDHLPLHTDWRIPDVAAMDLARIHRLNICDAVYLELALRLKLPLATLDGRLARAAATEGIGLVG